MNALVRAGGRNGRKSGKGQSEGQDELSHDGLLWLVGRVIGGLVGRPPARQCQYKLGGRNQFAEPSRGRALARGRINSRRSDSKLEADLRPVLHFSEDFQEIPSICFITHWQRWSWF